MSQNTQQETTNQHTVQLSGINTIYTNCTVTIMMLLSMIAIFLSFKCNAGKFNVVDFILAILFSPIYIPVRLGMSWNKCIA